MSKTTALPYSAPFRYTRPASDLQAAYGAQSGNPPILTEKKQPARNVKRQPARKAVKTSRAAKPAKAGTKAAKARGTKASAEKKR